MGEVGKWVLNSKNEIIHIRITAGLCTGVSCPASSRRAGERRTGRASCGHSGPLRLGRGCDVRVRSSLEDVVETPKAERRETLRTNERVSTLRNE